jgi:hypothetical protein
MYGKGCWMDNVFIGRLWRSVKYEDIYLKKYRTVMALRQQLDGTFSFTIRKDLTNLSHLARQPRFKRGSVKRSRHEKKDKSALVSYLKIRILLS